MATKAPTGLWVKLEMVLLLSWKRATSSCSDDTLRQSILLLDLPRLNLRMMRFLLLLADLLLVLAAQVLLAYMVRGVASSERAQLGSRDAHQLQTQLAMDEPSSAAALSVSVLLQLRGAA